ncbi:hypothetical protein Q428_07520 [Fervidicella metallireducens AeB]|uniref:Uncharacterized protein n=1 Tax=Fervidicella metallireducens AeB TaxID=1403537 RepID=A0A017RUT8_9CLOT|nr:hypothetical protein [Fervidicella metallireducens]EYE88518.1 hypothetical protein Q428_07520 [Fervidicella metallireducens AeB]
MSKMAVLKCRCCGSEKTLYWGKEFYVTRDGKEEDYGYPEGINDLAKESGISGFWVDKICKNCGEVVRESRYIEDATDEYMVAWMNFPKIDIIENCVKCESKNMLSLYELLVGEDMKIPCNECGEGRMAILEIK